MAALNTHDNVNYGIQIAQNDAPVTFNVGSFEPPHRACLRDLRVTDPRSDKTRIEESSGGLLKESYKWILENQEFGEWQHNETNCLLWVKGDPGKGKTMLLCGIIDELTRNATDANISFFFCQASDAQINNATAVLRGLIYLLVDQSPSLLSHVQAQYDKAGKALFEGPNAWSALSTIFKDILRDPSLKPTYLIIDALDECTIGRRFLLDMIVQESSSHSQVKWIVSSRNWPDIEERLGIASCIARISLELNDSCVLEAVNRFIQHKVALLANAKGYPEKTREIIYQHLVSNSQGTFLWVALVCHNLDRTRPRHAIKKLEALPPGLSSLYDRMINQLYQSEDAILCKQILAVMSTVYRPITLDELNTLIEEPCGDDLSEIIADCGSFLTLQKKVGASDHNTVTFVHQSAKDFLLKGPPEALNEILPRGIGAENHRIFAQSLELMFKTLRRDMFGLKSPGLLIDLVEAPSPNPLSAIQYACVYWVDHLADSQDSDRHAGGLMTDVEQRVNMFLQQKYLYWLEALSLLRCISFGIQAMKKLEILSKERGSSQEISNRAEDASRFIQYFKASIEISPLQVYYSPLIFSPARSLTRMSFSHERPSWILNNPMVGNDWDICIQTLEGNGESVEFQLITWSPDGSRLASTAEDSKVSIWDSVTGQSLHVFEEAQRFGNSTAWSPDGKWLAVCCNDKTIRIRETKTFQTKQVVKGHAQRVCSVAWSPDGSQIASTSKDETIRIWEPATGKSIRVWNLDTASLSLAAIWSPDGSKLAFCCDATVRICDSRTFQNVRILKGHNRMVHLIAWSPDGSQLASGSHDGNVISWCPDSGRRLWVQQLKYDDYVTSISWSPDGGRFASTFCFSSAVEIWDPATGETVNVLSGHESPVNSCTWSPDGCRLASASSDGIIRIWDMVTSQRAPTTFEEHSHDTHNIICSRNGTQVASRDRDGTVKIWDSVTGQIIRTFGRYDLMDYDSWSENGSPLAWSPDGSRLLSVHGNKIEIWDPAATSQSVQVFEGHSQEINSIVWSPEGTQLASASDDKTIRVWGLANSVQSVRVLGGYTSPVKLISWSKDGSRLASVSPYKPLEILDLATGHKVFCSKLDNAHDSHALAWSLDGTRLVSVPSRSSLDNTVLIWDTATGGLLSKLCITTPSFVEFDDIQGNYLHTDMGTYDIGSSFSIYPAVPRKIGFGLNDDRSWITYDGEKVIFLPVGFRPHWDQGGCFISRAGYVTIREPSGGLIFLAVTNIKRSPSGPQY